MPSHATSATTLNGIPSGLVTFETWGLWPANLAKDDAIGPKSQRLAHQFTQRDLTGPFRVGRTGLQPDDVAGEAQLGSVLDGDDTLAFGNLLGQHVEQRCLTGPRSPAHQEVAMRHDCVVEEFGYSLVRPASVHQRGKIGHRLGEAPHCDNRSVYRDWRDDCVEA